MRPKLQEVATLTGLSFATVSRVLNGKPGVAASTRRQVLDAVAELGYRDTPPRNGNGMVGIVIPELDNPIFPYLAQAIEARLARLELLSFVGSATPETVNEQDYLDHLLNNEAAGVVLVNGRYSQVELDFSSYEVLLEKGLPLVLVNGMGPECPLPSVALDIRAAAMAAVGHLHSYGHHRIGCLIGPSKYWSSRLFLDGYQSALESLGLPYDEGLVSESVFSVEGGRAGAAKLLEAEVTAVATPGDLIALGVIAAARAWSLRVPGDLSVVGLDGTPIIAHTDPPLTSLRQPVERMARTVARLLNEQRHGHPAGTLHLFQPELVAGGSTGPAPSESVRSPGLARDRL
jgi:LacI family transcriptional regulator, repressor for deo operon, udp, cdd, tsx, nupC, and nupG